MQKIFAQVETFSTSMSLCQFAPPPANLCLAAYYIHSVCNCVTYKICLMFYKAPFVSQASGHLQNVKCTVSYKINL